jgi:hypothetical protein
MIPAILVMSVDLLSSAIVPAAREQKTNSDTIQPSKFIRPPLSYITTPQNGQMC